MPVGSYFVDMAVFKTLCILVVYQFFKVTLSQATYLCLLFSGIDRNAEVPVIGRSQRYCSNIHLESSIRSGIFDFPIVNLIRIRSKEPAPLFENNIDIYIERFPRIQ